MNHNRGIETYMEKEEFENIRSLIYSININLKTYKINMSKKYLETAIEDIDKAYHIMEHLEFKEAMYRV